MNQRACVRVRDGVGFVVLRMASISASGRGGCCIRHSCLALASSRERFRLVHLAHRHSFAEKVSETSARTSAPQTVSGGGLYWREATDEDLTAVEAKKPGRKGSPKTKEDLKA